MRTFILALLFAAAPYFPGQAADLPPASAQASQPTNGKPLDLQFTAVDGRTVDLAQLRGKVVLIDFWATWCPDCRKEVPDVIAAFQKYHDQGLEIIGISLDESKDALAAYTAKNGMPWPQYYDGKKWSSDLGTRFNIREIPTLWLVDQKGNVVSKSTDGVKTAEIESLLKGPVASSAP